MVRCFGLVQNILSIVIAKTVQRLHGSKLVQKGKRKYFAGAFIVTGLTDDAIALRPVAEFCWRVVVMAVDVINNFAKCNVFRVGFYLCNEGV